MNNNVFGTIKIFDDIEEFLGDAIFCMVCKTENKLRFSHRC